MSRKAQTPATATFTPPSARRPWAGMLLSMIGLALVAAGPLAVFGPEYAPQLAQLAEVFQVYDLRADVVSACGLVLVGLGRIASYLYTNTNTLLEPGFVAHDLEQVDAGLRELQSRMKELRDEQALTRERLAGLSRQIGEQRDVSAQGHENAQNALFRLASSLDQLGANLEHSLQAQVHGVLERVQECHQLTEASREYTAESIDAMGRELAQYVYEVVTSVGGPRPQVHPVFSEAGPGQGAGPAEPVDQTPQEESAPTQTEFDASTYATQAGYVLEEEPGESTTGAAEVSTGTEEPGPQLSLTTEQQPGAEPLPASGPLTLSLEPASAPAAEQVPGSITESPAESLSESLSGPPAGPPAELELGEPLQLEETAPSMELGILDEVTGQGFEETCSQDEPEDQSSPLGLLDSLGDHPEEPAAALPSDGQETGTEESPEVAEHQPLPNVLPPLNPRDPRNLNG